MAKRIWAAGGIAILGVGLILTADAAARSGGAGGGFRGGPPGALRAPVGKTAVHPRATHPFNNAARLHPFNGAARLHHRAGLPLGWWSTGWYGGYYDPSNYVMLHDRPAYVEPPNVGPGYPAPVLAPEPKIVNVIVYRPGCSTDIETTTLPNGKEHAIRMVRC